MLLLEGHLYLLSNNSLLPEIIIYDPDFFLNYVGVN
jgi:hypothetical protein